MIHKKEDAITILAQQLVGITTYKRTATVKKYDKNEDGTISEIQVEVEKGLTQNGQDMIQVRSGDDIISTIDDDTFFRTNNPNITEVDWIKLVSYGVEAVSGYRGFNTECKDGVCPNTCGEDVKCEDCPLNK